MTSVCVQHFFQRCVQRLASCPTFCLRFTLLPRVQSVRSNPVQCETVPCSVQCIFEGSAVLPCRQRTGFHLTGATSAAFFAAFSNHGSFQCPLQRLERPPHVLSFLQRPVTNAASYVLCSKLDSVRCPLQRPASCSAPNAQSSAL